MVQHYTTTAMDKKVWNVDMLYQQNWKEKNDTKWPVKQEIYKLSICMDSYNSVVKYHCYTWSICVVFCFPVSHYSFTVAVILNPHVAMLLIVLHDKYAKHDHHVLYAMWWWYNTCVYKNDPELQLHWKVVVDEEKTKTRLFLMLSQINSLSQILSDMKNTPSW